MGDENPSRVLARYRPRMARTILLGSADGLVLTPREIVVRGERLPLASTEPPYTYVTAPRRIAALANTALAVALVAYRPEAWPLLTALAAVAAWVNLLTRTTLVLRGADGERLYEVWGQVDALDGFADAALAASKVPDASDPLEDRPILGDVPPPLNDATLEPLLNCISCREALDSEGSCFVLLSGESKRVREVTPREQTAGLLHPPCAQGRSKRGEKDV